MDLHSKELYPLLVSQVQDVVDTPEVREKIWTKARLLPKDIQDLLLSDELKVYILDKSKEANLLEPDVEHFSRLIRLYFFDEDTPDHVAAGIGALFHRDVAFGKVTLEEIESLQIKTEDEDELAIDPAFESPVAPTELLTLESAYDKFPQVLKQLVTTDRIITKPFLNPLSPTVKNWIAVYEKISGVKRHSAIERGDFLYRSQACKAISDKDRNKLAQLLKARDEDMELTFDSEKGGILWESKAVITEQTDVSPTQQLVPEATHTVNSVAETTQSIPSVPQTGIMKSTSKTVISPTPSTGGVIGKDGSFSPQVGRKKHGELNVNGDPQIVTRPRVALGAAGHKPDATLNASSDQESQAIKKPMFVGSARRNREGASTVKTKAEVDLTQNQQPSLKNFAQLSTRKEQDKKGTTQDVTKDDLRVNFSSGQTLPAERAKVTTRELEPPTAPTEAKTTRAPKRSPFHIDPMGGR